MLIVPNLSINWGHKLYFSRWGILHYGIIVIIDRGMRLTIEEFVDSNSISFVLITSMDTIFNSLKENR